MVKEGFPLDVAKAAGLPESIVDELGDALIAEGALEQLLV